MMSERKEASKNTITDLNLVQDGDCTLPPGRRIRSWDSWQTSSWTEQYFFFLVQRCHSACRKFSLLAIDGRCRQRHRAPHFLMHSCCAVSLQSCCQSVQSHIDLHALAWLKTRSTLSAFRPKTFTPRPRRNVVHLAEPHTTHGHSFLAFS